MLLTHLHVELKLFLELVAVKQHKKNIKTQWVSGGFQVWGTLKISNWASFFSEKEWEQPEQIQ